MVAVVPLVAKGVDHHAVITRILHLVFLHTARQAGLHGLGVIVVTVGLLALPKLVGDAGKQLWVELILIVVGQCIAIGVKDLGETVVCP